MSVAQSSFEPTKSIVKQLLNLPWWNSFKASSNDFWQKSLLHGSRNVIERGRLVSEKVIWLFIIFIGFGLAFFFLIDIWTNFTSNPTITTLDNQNYPISRVSYPAVGLCNVNRLSKTMLAKYADEL